MANRILKNPADGIGNEVGEGQKASVAGTVRDGVGERRGGRRNHYSDISRGGKLRGNRNALDRLVN